MSVTEIILLVLGILVFILSFILPARQRKVADNAPQVDEAQIKELIDKEVQDAKRQINDIVDETITYSMEKTERSMDRLTNEKMLAVNEYSDTVLEQINKNHKEAVFLYDMLNDKHESVKTTVSEATKAVTEVKQTVKDVEISVKEVEERFQAGAMTNATPETLMPAQVQEEVVEEVVWPMIQEMAETEEITEEIDDFVPISPKKVEIIMPPAQEAAEKKVKKSKAEKVDLNIAPLAKGGKQNNNERILELHRAGKSNMAIAKELGLGIGEVKLVIDLFEGI